MVVVEVWLEMDRLDLLVLPLELLGEPCSGRKYGLARMHTHWMLLEVACIFAHSLRFATSRASYLSMAATCPEVFMLRFIARVA